LKTTWQSFTQRDIDALECLLMGELCLPIASLKHGANDRYVVGADLQISFPRHREWLLMADCRLIEARLSLACIQNSAREFDAE
jgi:hypothetical protein